MNCRGCNTRIDYNYVTNCAQCGCKLESGGLPKLEPSINSSKQIHAWLFLLANVGYTLFTSAVGMISGAVVMNFGGSMVYWALRSGETASCSEGIVIGMLILVSGAFLGTIGGTAFAMKHPIGPRSR